MLRIVMLGAIAASLNAACRSRSRDEPQATTPPAPGPIDDRALLAAGGPPPPPPPPPGWPLPNVPPATLEPLRIAGSRDIPPSARARNAIRKSGKYRIIGSYKLCLDTDGSVMSTSMLKSCGFGDYDRELMAQMRTWRFRPYEVEGAAKAVCTAYTFIYPAPSSSAAEAERRAEVGGFWCISWSVFGVRHSSCSRSEDRCKRARDGAVQVGAVEPSQCEWQQTAWVARIKTTGKSEAWFFAEEDHCEATTLTFGGGKCKATR